jgi:hypothetical protein
MTLKQQVLAGTIARQSDAEALDRINHYLTSGFIVAALRQARAGAAHDGYNTAKIGLTQTEERVLGEQMGKVDGPIRHRMMKELPDEGIAPSQGALTLNFSLIGDPTRPKPQRERYPDLA